MNNILSISGGKDSTAMLLEMLERNDPIHAAVFFDTGWEFPEMYSHIDKLEKYTRVKIWRLHPVLPFDYLLTSRPVIAKKGDMKGKVHRIGYGWPFPARRWCTGIKVDALNKFEKPIENAVSCIGYAADELHRSLHNEKILYRFPLQEYGITEADALAICYSHGFDWDGLYNHFSRVSCFCCPLKKLDELRKLYNHFPNLWKRMLDMEDAMDAGTRWRGFKDYTTVHDLDKRFACENRQLKLF